MQAAVLLDVFGSAGPDSSGAPWLLTVKVVQLTVTLGKLSAGVSGSRSGIVSSRTFTVVLSPAGSMERLQLNPPQDPSAIDIAPFTFSFSVAKPPKT